ncbi:MAG TPA: nitrilase-related carbon-nitrogen hydrolase [Fibrobacteria bacterium]|nr:nitrilase-related carbon-nitrogen hydrolase [Fibrobacteria bacterium]HOX52272.1 nitrilase-related carbon-nitrogen hydrolase [Fibrobacteria bacterium]
MDHLRLGLVQYSPDWCDRQASRAKIDALLGERPEVDLLVFPEMTLTGFAMDPGATTLGEEDHAFFRDLAIRHRCAVVYCGVVDGFNRATLLGRDGAALGTYDKRHLFSLGHEAEHFAAGDRCPTWNFETWRIRPAICYDLRFPYHFWHGAEEVDLVVVCACWPGSREAHWRSLLLARAIENQVWVAGVNRVGEEPTLKYNGASMVLEPSGKCVLDALDTPGLRVVAISHEANRLVRHRFPFLQDRREA